MKSVTIKINSLNLTFSEFETIVWNETNLDSIRTREYLPINTYNEEAALALIKHISEQCDPIFKIERWINLTTKTKKTYDTSLFWLRVFLSQDVSVMFPSQMQNVEYLSAVRKISPPIYSKLMKTLQNF